MATTVRGARGEYVDVFQLSDAPGKIQVNVVDRCTESASGPSTRSS